MNKSKFIDKLDEVYLIDRLNIRRLILVRVARSSYLGLLYSRLYISPFSPFFNFIESLFIVRFISLRLVSSIYFRIEIYLRNGIEEKNRKIGEKTQQPLDLILIKITPY